MSLAGRHGASPARALVYALAASSGALGCSSSSIDGEPSIPGHCTDSARTSRHAGCVAPDAGAGGATSSGGTASASSGGRTGGRPGTGGAPVSGGNGGSGGSKHEPVPEGGTFPDAATTSDAAPPDGSACSPDASGEGACFTPPSCVGLPRTCGLAENESCCTGLLVPGGDFYRSYDGVTTGPLNYTSKEFPATVSDFRLDKFSVTVGRFRKFVGAWVAGWRPEAGSGRHSHLNEGKGLGVIGGGFEPGWQPSWASGIPDTQLAWDAQFTRDEFTMWTSAPGPNENRPINYVSWYEMVAFAIWDGGFLPSDAERNYAAAGGREQRVYPWGSAPPGADAARAAWGCHYDGNSRCAAADVPRVGAIPAGDGRFGHADLAGGVWNWVLDSFQDFEPPLLPGDCVDCVDLTPRPYRALRGGSFISEAMYLQSSAHFYSDPAMHYTDVGARCARVP